MFKKLKGIAVAMVMLFGAFGLAGCTESLEEYKATKSAELQEYANAKGESNYTAENWAILQQAITDGKVAIDAATDKASVDKAVTTAKGEISVVQELKQGTYTADDGKVRIVLHGENEFVLEIMIMSHLPTGNYEVINGKLILHYMPDVDLCFDIGSDKLVFSEISDSGQLSGEWIVKVGTVFNLVKEDATLKQGTYTADDGKVRIVLHGENDFVLEIMIMSHLPTGNYEVINGKLILHYMPDVDLCFNIGSDILVFSEISDNGQLSGEWIVKVGTVFIFMANE